MHLRRFNGGSALAANGNAALAIFNTILSASGGMMMWLFMDSLALQFFHPKLSGAAIGAVVGLIGITPGCGYMEPGWALVVGVMTSFLSWRCTEFMHKQEWVDDTLDVFTCHGVGGAVGSLLTGLFAQVCSH